jgi:predicted RecA/RadA family phage recombinase
MNNYVQPGKVLSIPVTADFTKGEGVQIGAALFGVAVDTVTSGGTGQLWTEGVFTLAKTTGAAEVAARGARVYWNSTTKKATFATGGNLGIGVFVGATSANADTTLDVMLTPGHATLA